MNPYEVLGVKRDAKDKTIKEAYKKLVRKWHTDQFHTEEEIEQAKGKIQEITEAYQMLKTPEKRKAYDTKNPVSSNVYEYYAKKQTKAEARRKSTKKNASDIEQEKQRRAVVTFLEVEYKHKNDIYDMLQELANVALERTITEEEYQEYLTLIVEEQQDCVMKMKKIIEVANQKQIKGLEANKKQVQEAIAELTKKVEETPKSLKEAHYVEETRRVTEEIYRIMSGFSDRLKEITSFNLLDRTWEFQNDSQLKVACEKQKRKVEKLLGQIKWIQQTSAIRKIKLNLIRIPRPDDWRGDEEITLEEYKKRVEEREATLTLSLKELQEKFWKEECGYRESYSERAKGKIILDWAGGYYKADRYKGNFICPPHIKGIDWHALYWLENIESITIPEYAIGQEEIELPRGNLKRIKITFGKQEQVVDLSDIDATEIERRGEYVYIGGDSWSKEKTFALIDAKGVYRYDTKRLCELNGVSSLEELNSLWDYCRIWEGYELQVHAWAQSVGKLPNIDVMRVLPASVEVIKKWVSLDKINFEKALFKTEEAYRKRLIRLYLALGALKEGERHIQAEELISKLEVTTMYRSRLERVPKEMPEQDPVFSVPKSAVDLVQENIENKEFLPYGFAFLEGYQLVYSEARKAKVELSTEFVIETLPRYIFHKKLDVKKGEKFIRQILQEEKNQEVEMMDKIVNMYAISQRENEKGKSIIETVDIADDSKLHYRFFDLQSWESYQAFECFFQLKERFAGTRSYYAVEAENVFLSDASHAIEILDSENKRVAIVILNLWKEGELFADIASCENKTVEVLETIKRALIDQKNQNPKVTGISIGMNEAPSTTKHNEWHKVVQNATEEWLQEVQWLKFEYLFKNRPLGISYKGYRTRFVLEGKREYTRSPNPWEDQKERRRYW